MNDLGVSVQVTSRHHCSEYHKNLEAAIEDKQECYHSPLGVTLVACARIHSSNAIHAEPREPPVFNRKIPFCTKRGIQADLFSLLLALG